MKVFNCFDERDLNSSTYQRYSVSPSLKDLNETDYLILAHATSSEFLDSIITRGLLVNSVTNIKVKDRLDSDSKCVYLSAGDFNFYMNRAVKEFGGQGIVVVVKVNKLLLRADEHSLSFDVKNNNSLSEDEKLIVSMNFIGACKHIGNISKDNIIKIYTQDGKVIYEKNEN